MKMRRCKEKRRSDGKSHIIAAMVLLCARPAMAAHLFLWLCPLLFLMPFEGITNTTPLIVKCCALEEEKRWTIITSSTHFNCAAQAQRLLIDPFKKVNCPCADCVCTHDDDCTHGDVSLRSFLAWVYAQPNWPNRWRQCVCLFFFLFRCSSNEFIAASVDAFHTQVLSSFFISYSRLFFCVSVSTVKIYMLSIFMVYSSTAISSAKINTHGRNSDSFLCTLL